MGNAFHTNGNAMETPTVVMLQMNRLVISRRFYLKMNITACILCHPDRKELYQSGTEADLFVKRTLV